MILRRLLQLPLILGTVFVLTLLAVWVLPGSPLDSADGRQVDPSVMRAMEARYGLDASAPVFAGRYLAGLARGDLGPSLSDPGRSVNDVIAQAAPVSIVLGLAALGVAIVLGTTAGVLAALPGFPGRPPGPGLRAGGAASLGLALVGVSLPSFVVGTVLLAVFAGLSRRLFPGLDFLHLPLGGWDSPASIVLPALALGLAPAAYIARLLRSELIESSTADYVRTARAKGLSPARVVLGHQLRPSMLPVLSYLGPAAASVLTGSFVVEKVFNLPGLGSHFVNAVLNKDQFLLLALVLGYSTLLVLLNLLVDVLYRFVDPRVEA